MVRSRERTRSSLLPLAVAALAWALVAAWGTGCDSEPGVAGPEGLGPGPEQLVVSDPVVLRSEVGNADGSLDTEGVTLTAHRRDDGLAAALEDPVFSFVSFQPRTYPEGELVEIENVATGQGLSTPMVNGGSDPVGIPAAAGDTVEIRILKGFALLAAFSREVPDKLAPTVVRADPPKGKTKVPLNYSATVIFSEPIRIASLTPESFRLELDEERVPGFLSTVQGGLGVRFTPLDDLELDTEYTIVVGPGLADLSGDTFGTTFTSTFRTIELPENLPGKIAYEDHSGVNTEIYTMKPDGSGVVQVTDSVNGSFSMAPALSRDGTRVAFVVAVLEQGDGGAVVSDFEIYTARADGTEIFNVTNHPEFDGWRAAWSPDGSRIAFPSTRGDPANGDVYTISADGTDLRRLTVDPADDANPAWSPDGSRIAFVSNRDGDFEIWVMDADGTGVTPLTDHPAEDAWPAWSPDGSRIAFASGREGVTHVFVMNADGSAVERLTGESYPGTLPSWSPDGEWIAYDCVGICVMRADGSGPRKVSGGMFPSWSW